MSEAPSQFSFSRIEQYSSQRFQRALRIYQAEFPRKSRLSLARVRQLLQAGTYQLLVVENTTETLGFALIWTCPRPAFAHLDYLAVAHRWKGKGVGTALYRWVINHLHELSPRASLLTLEVDAELIAFYQRSHTQVLREVRYWFPGPLGPLPMHLMAYDVRRRTALRRRTVQNVIRALYCGLHRRSTKDPWLRECLAHVPTIVSLA